MQKVTILWLAPAARKVLLKRDSSAEMRGSNPAS